MAETTAITWADATWNPHYGCRRVSSGCDHCYADRDMTRRGLDFGSVTRSKTTFNDPLKWTEPKRIFACSWSDLFIHEADAWRDEIWDIVRRTPHHKYLFLTKRIRRVAKQLPPDWGNGYPNVWLGISAENQAAYDRRWPVLEGIPSVVRWVSAEPLLGPIDLKPASNHLPDWIVVGGESGPHHRPMELKWASDIMVACDPGIAFFFKQIGGLRPTDGGHVLEGEEHMQLPQPWFCDACGQRGVVPMDLHEDVHGVLSRIWRSHGRGSRFTCGAHVRVVS